MSKFVSHTRSLFLIDNTKNPQVNGIYSKIWQHLPKSNFNLIWQAIEDDRYPEYSWSLSSPSYNYSSRIPVYWNTSLHSHRGCSDIHCVLKNKKKWRENQLNILFQMSGLETLKKYQQAILKYISLVQFSQGLIIDFGICMVNGSKKSKGLL